MKTAMILAAGRGERLKPLTNTLPKALCRLNNVPLIDYHLRNLAKAGFHRVIINHAYLGGKIRQYIAGCQHHGLDIHFSPEPPGGLETGGGIVNALNLLGDEPFIAINGDIYTDFDYSSLNLSEPHLAHVVLIPKPDLYPTGDFGLSPTKHVQNESRTHTFSGIACYHPKLFQSHALGRYSMTPILRSLAEKQYLTGEIHSGIWFDIGSVERLQWAEAHLLDR